METDNRAVARRKLARLIAQRQATTIEAASVVAARAETYAELAVRVAARRRSEGIADFRTEQSRETVWVIPEIGQLAVSNVRPEHIAGILRFRKVQRAPGMASRISLELQRLICCVGAARKRLDSPFPRHCHRGN